MKYPERAYVSPPFAYFPFSMLSVADVLRCWSLKAMPLLTARVRTKCCRTLVASTEMLRRLGGKLTNDRFGRGASQFLRVKLRFSKASSASNIYFFLTLNALSFV